jgi:hypothetical protein
MKPTNPRFHLTLEVLPDPTDPGGYRRLRAMLKACLRCWRLRCVSLQPPTPDAVKANVEALEGKSQFPEN